MDNLSLRVWYCLHNNVTYYNVMRWYTYSCYLRTLFCILLLLYKFNEQDICLNLPMINTDLTKIKNHINKLLHKLKFPLVVFLLSIKIKFIKIISHCIIYIFRSSDFLLIYSEWNATGSLYQSPVKQTTLPRRTRIWTHGIRVRTA